MEEKTGVVGVILTAVSGLPTDGIVDAVASLPGTGKGRTGAIIGDGEAFNAGRELPTNGVDDVRNALFVL